MNFTNKTHLWQPCVCSTRWPRPVLRLEDDVVINPLLLQGVFVLTQQQQEAPSPGCDLAGGSTSMAQRWSRRTRRVPALPNEDCLQHILHNLADLVSTQQLYPVSQRMRALVASPRTWRRATVNGYSLLQSITFRSALVLKSILLEAGQVRCAARSIHHCDLISMKHEIGYFHISPNVFEKLHVKLCISPSHIFNMWK